MKRNLVGVMAVSIVSLLFAGCGNTDSAVPEPTTTTTAAKTVVNSYCGDMALAAQAGLITRQESTEAVAAMVLTGDTLGVITLVWSDGSISPTKEQCIWKDGLSLEERGREVIPYTGPRK